MVTTEESAQGGPALDREIKNEDSAVEEQSLPSETSDDEALASEAPAKEGPMAELVRSAGSPPAIDDVVEGPVIAVGRARVFVDLHPYGTGIIYGREYLSARETLKNVNIGDTIAAKVIGTDNPEGYIELSLREARQALIWGEAETALQKKTVFELPIMDANKGGLIIMWNSLQGFLPASQLSPANYPRVPDGDKDKIFAE
ncbi:MAG: S1 RNA-binding domain-containing protein, partial [Patescibacteria group bacterium]|nr:S1 RNA-binding domain-containing protein [Patescibacteria group bacterium]